MNTTKCDSNANQFFRGIARVVPHDGAMHPARMTDALNRFYSGNPAHAARAACTAGVRLALQTDSDSINIGLQYHRSSRPLSQCDVFIDGSLGAPFGPADGLAPGNIFEHTLQLPGTGMHSVEIYLTHCREVYLTRLEFAEGARTESLPAPRKRWLAIGDSITQGMTATTPACTWAALAARQLNWDLHNIAVGGAVMQAEAGKLALDLPWDIATVAFGANDFHQNRTVIEFQAETRGLLEHLLQRPDAVIYLLTPIPWAGRVTPNDTGLHFEDYRQALRQVAAEFPRVRIVEGKTLVDDDPAMFVDDVHPNDAGMQQFADRFCAALT